MGGKEDIEAGYNKIQSDERIKTFSSLPYPDNNSDGFVGYFVWSSLLEVAFQFLFFYPMEFMSTLPEFLTLTDMVMRFFFFLHGNKDFTRKDRKIQIK